MLLWLRLSAKHYVGGGSGCYSECLVDGGEKKKKVGVYGILAHVKGIPGGPNRLVALQFLYVIVQVASLRENPQNSDVIFFFPSLAPPLGGHCCSTFLR